MKAAFYAAPMKIEVRDLPEPATPVDGVKIKVTASAVCGSDLRRWREGPAPDVEPVVPGHETVGVVIEVGRACGGFKIGDRLAIGPDVHCGTCWYCEHGMFNLCDHLVLYGITPGRHGGLAERMVLSKELLTRGIWHFVAESLSDEAASLSEPCSSVIACHQENGTTLGDLVVVMGAGPIGCLHTVIAKAHGARVIVSEPNPIRRKIAEQFEPEAIVDPTVEDLRRAVLRRKSVGADKVICANPVAATQQQGVEIVRKGGKVILFGGLPKAAPLTTLDANRIHYHQIEVVGSFSYHPVHHAQALDFLQRGVIPAEKIINAVYPLDQVQAAFEAAADGRALKVVIKP